MRAVFLELGAPQRERSWAPRCTSRRPQSIDKTEKVEHEESSAAGSNDSPLWMNAAADPQLSPGC